MQATLTPMLPPSPLKDSEHSPFAHDVQIQGIADHVDVMSSLQKPKKVTLVSVRFHARASNIERISVGRNLAAAA